MDEYSNFTELEQNEIRDEDYTILYRKVDSKIAIMAPHGGGIEPGTIDIADSIAGCDYTFYAFKGLKKKGNKILHINSSNFDEALGLQTSENALVTISIHGSQDKAERIHIGGKNQELKQRIMYALRTGGYEARINIAPGLRGIRSENICNRCRSGKGVQLEISRGLREKMFDNLDHRLLRKKRVTFYEFVNTLKEVLNSREGDEKLWVRRI